MIRELDTVVLSRDVEEQGLKEGDVGAVVHRYGDGTAFEVEFVTAEGKSVAVLTLTEADIRPMNHGEILHVRKVMATDRPPAKVGQLFDLTPWEVEVLQLVGTGYTSPVIAAQLRISEKTLVSHFNNIIAKLHASNLIHAATIAARAGLLGGALGSAGGDDPRAGPDRPVGTSDQ